MPYIFKTARPYFDEHPHEAKEDGDITYVFYKLFLAQWKKEPRWRTYAGMRKSLRDVRTNKELSDLVIGLAKNGASIDAISVAATAAVDEVKRRYVDKYEDDKRNNPEYGDIE